MQLTIFIITFSLLSAVLSPIHCYLQYSFYPIKEVFLSGEHVLFRFNLTNNYETGLLYLPWGTPLEEFQADVLTIARGEIDVGFICPIASRLPPTADDYKFLPAGAHISMLYNVSDCYTVDTAGNYTANFGRYLSAKLIYSLTAVTNYDPYTFSLAYLSIDNIAFCVGEACGLPALPSLMPGYELFNTTLISSSSTLLPEYTLICVTCFIYCVVITLIF